MGIIYRHISPVGKSYIGQTKYDTWEERVKGSNPLQAYRSLKFSAAIKKYGWDNFDHEILEKGLKSQDELDTREAYWIQFYDSVNNGYNFFNGVNITEHYKDFSPLRIKIPKDTLIDLYWGQQLSTTDIAKIYDTTHPVILNLMRFYNIPRRSRATLNKNQQEIKNKNMKARKLICLVCEAIFETLSKRKRTCSRTCQSKLSRESKPGINGQITPSIPKSHKIFLENIDEIKRLYYKEYETIKSIANRYGYNEGTLRGFFEKQGIQIYKKTAHSYNSGVYGLFNRYDNTCYGIGKALSLKDMRKRIMRSLREHCCTKFPELNNLVINNELHVKDVEFRPLKESTAYTIDQDLQDIKSKYLDQIP